MKTVVLILFTFIGLEAISQENLSGRLNRYFSMIYQNAVIQKDSSSKVVVYAQGDKQKIFSQLENWGIPAASQYGNVYRFELPAFRLLDLARTEGVIVLEEGKKSAKAMDDSARFNSRVDSVFSGQGNLSSSYTGKGVIMGIVDSGVDYTHGDFRNPGDSVTRILRFYDYNATPPRGYSSSQVNQSISNPTLPIDDSWHGTHVAGVAVGNGNAYARFRGIAPEASLLVSDLTPEQWFDDIISSTDSMFAFASAQKKPCVINLSLGSNYGPHDGTDSYSQALEALAKADSGRAIVIAAGNSTTLFPHLGYTLSADTNFTYLTASTAYPVYTQTYLQATQTNAQFRISLDTLGSGSRYRRFASSPFRSINNIPPTGVKDTLRHPNQTPYCIVTTYASNYTNQRVLIEHEIKYLNPTGLKTPLYRFEATGSGSFHLWTEDGRMVTNTTTIGRAFPDSSKYRRPDDRHNMAGYFNCARDLIAVANYTARSAWIPCGTTTDQSLSQIAGSISFNSSYGPNVDGFQKPDIGGAGDNTMGARSSNVPSPDSRATIGCFHRRARGTSNAAAVITGALCLYFQANPTAGWYTIKQDLIQTALRDGFTGVTPNSLWGFGKLNAMAFVKAGENRSCKNLQGESRIKASILSTKDSICPGETILLTANGNGSNLSFFWLNNQQNTKQIAIQQAGNYRVVVSDSLGCLDTSDFKTIILKQIFSGNITGSSHRIGANLQLSSSANQWEWQLNNGNSFTSIQGSNNSRSWTVTQNGLYRVALSHPNGCISYSDTFQISAPPIGKYDWVIGLNSNSKARITHVQSNGNQIFWAGVYEDSISVGPTVYKTIGPRKTNAFLMSSDLSGNLIWFQDLSGRYDEVITAISVSPNGKLWVGGNFKRSFSYANLATNQSVLINLDCFVMEIDPNSGIDTKRWIFPGDNNRKIQSILIDSSHQIYLGGWFTGRLNQKVCRGGSDIFVTKVDTNFQTLWTISEGGVNMDVLSQIYLQNGILWGTGYFGGMRTPGAFGLYSSGAYNGLIFQLNPTNGQTLGAENIGGTGLEYLWSLTGNQRDKIWVTGSFTGDLSIGNQRFSNATSEDFFIGEYQSNRQQWNWVKRSSLGGNERITHLQFAQNQLFLGGFSGNSFQYDQINTHSPNSINGLLGSIDTLGNNLWWLRPNPSFGNLATTFWANSTKFYFGGYQTGNTQYGNIMNTQLNSMKAILGSTSQTNNTLQTMQPVARNSQNAFPIFPDFILENNQLSFIESAPKSIIVNQKDFLQGVWKLPLSSTTETIRTEWENGGFFELNLDKNPAFENQLFDWNGIQCESEQNCDWTVYNLQGQVIQKHLNDTKFTPYFPSSGIFLIQANGKNGETRTQKIGLGK